MTHSAKIIAGGKIVIPADIRRQLGLVEGDVLAVERDGDTVVLKSRKQVLREVRESFSRLIKTPFTVDEFIAERRAEAARE